MRQKIELCVLIHISLIREIPEYLTDFEDFATTLLNPILIAKQHDFQKKGCILKKTCIK